MTSSILDIDCIVCGAACTPSSFAWSNCPSHGKAANTVTEVKSRKVIRLEQNGKSVRGQRKAALSTYESCWVVTSSPTANAQERCGRLNRLRCSCRREGALHSAARAMKSARSLSTVTRQLPSQLPLLLEAYIVLGGALCWVIQ